MKRFLPKKPKMKILIKNRRQFIEAQKIVFALLLVKSPKIPFEKVVHSHN